MTLQSYRLLDTIEIINSYLTPVKKNSGLSLLVTLLLAHLVHPNLDRLLHFDLSRGITDSRRRGTCNDDPANFSFEGIVFFESIEFIKDPNCMPVDILFVL